MPALLTPSYIKKLEPKQREYLVTDSKVAGLVVVVRPNGSKRFCYRYRHPTTQKVVSEPIGSALSLSLVDARDSVAIKAGDIAKGIDIRARRKNKDDSTSDELTDDLRLYNYIEKYYKPYAQMNSVTADEIIRALKREFEFLKDKPIDAIDSADIEHWRDKRGSAVTFKRLKTLLAYLKACLNTAVKHYELIKTYPLINYRLKRKLHEKINAPKVRYMLEKEELRLLSVLDSRDQELREERARYVEWQSKRNHKRKCVELFFDSDFPDHITPIIILAYQTGFDIGDIFDFDWKEHIDLQNKQISKIRNKISHKQDNPKPVVVRMSPKVEEIFMQWGKQHGMSGRVFRSPITGGRLDNINKAWWAIRGRANLEDFRFKDFRHTFGSRLAIDGTDLYVIRDLMGHTSIKTTEIYVHLCPNQKTDAVLSAFG